MTMSKKYFKRKSTLTNEELANVESLQVSDLCLQTPNHIVQFDLVREDDSKVKYEVKTGTYLIQQTSSGCSLASTVIKNPEILKEIDSSRLILDEKDRFFNKLNLYDKIKTLRNRPQKRAILLCGKGGCGKSTNIAKAVKEMEDEQTSVIFWNTTEVSSSDINKFFTLQVEYAESVKRLILVIEDIGGGTVEDYHGSRGADSSLLQFLEGSHEVFKVPTFIIATTNNPEQSVGVLIDRPGRFDKVIEILPPNASDSVALMEFIAERRLDDAEKEAIKKASKEEFSIAHLQEVVVRSLLEDKTFTEVVNELIKHKKKFKDGFQDPVRGIGLK